MDSERLYKELATSIVRHNLGPIYNFTLWLVFNIDRLRNKNGPKPKKPITS